MRYAKGLTMLSDQDFTRSLEYKWLEITPFDKKLQQPASIDVRLDKFFRVFNNHAYDAIDPSIEQAEMTSAVEIDEHTPFVLHPGEFVLGSTYEVIGVNALLAARLEGKSSLGRLGLIVHSTAGFIDPGFKGNITLELTNINTLPIKLWYGMKIGQICAFKLNSMAQMVYGDDKIGSRYQGQGGPTPSRSWKNWTTDLTPSTQES